MACILGIALRQLFSQPRRIPPLPLFFSVLLLLIVNSSAFSQSKIKVLMLGDAGFHKPSEFYRTLAQPLEKNSIELKYSENLSDINAENLKEFAGLLIFANIERISPEV